MASRLGARVGHDATDVLKSMMAGAHVAMMRSALLKYGIEHIGVVLAGIERWMEDHEYQTIKQMRGSLNLVNVIAKSVVTAACSSQIRCVRLLGRGTSTSASPTSDASAQK